ncbi:MAG TPA: hypothetical protein VER55_01480 [Ardenticatenaceae bacterium]|nr:hypothetical protein [Ardenticatenaceae bacterium]
MMPDDDSRFTGGSWLVLALALLLGGFSLVHSLYCLSLPSDGWSYANESATGTGLFLDRNLTGAPSPLRSGDELVAVEGQPVTEIKARAVVARPVRPANWAVGQSVRYSVARDGRDMALDVVLTRRPASQYLREMAGQLVESPGLVPQLLIALFVFFRRPQSRPAWVLLLFAVANAVPLLFSESVSGTDVVALPEMFYVEAYWPADFFNTWIWTLLLLPLMVHLSLIFPVVKRPMRRYRVATLVAIYSFFPAFLLFIALSRPGRGLLYPLTVLFAVLPIVIVLASAVHTLVTVRDPVGRAQVRWVAWGIFLALAPALLGFFLIQLGVVAESLAYRLVAPFELAFPLAMAVAILRYRLFDIDVLINRTLVYSVLTVALLLVYGIGVVLFERLLRGLAGQESDLAIIASTLGVAALFSPLRRAIQDGVDRRFYRRRYDAEQILAAFGETLREETDLDRLTAALLAVVEETLQPAHVSLWLREPRERLKVEG